MKRQAVVAALLLGLVAAGISASDLSANPPFARKGVSGGGGGGGSAQACDGGSSVCAQFENGQAFVTWDDLATGATGNNYRYKLYRSTSPITSGNYGSATLIASEILNNSGQLFGGTVNQTGAAFNQTNRQSNTMPMAKISDLAGGTTTLTYGKGLQVFTATGTQNAYYAVVAVVRVERVPQRRDRRHGQLYRLGRPDRRERRHPASGPVLPHNLGVRRDRFVLGQAAQSLFAPVGERRRLPVLLRGRRLLAMVADHRGRLAGRACDDAQRIAGQQRALSRHALVDRSDDARHDLGPARRGRDGDQPPGPGVDAEPAGRHGEPLVSDHNERHRSDAVVRHLELRRRYQPGALHRRIDGGVGLRQYRPESNQPALLDGMDGYTLLAYGSHEHRLLAGPELDIDDAVQGDARDRAEHAWEHGIVHPDR